MKTVFILPFMIAGIAGIAVYFLVVGFIAVLKKRANLQDSFKLSKSKSLHLLFGFGLILGFFGVGFLAFALVLAYGTSKRIF